MATAPRCAWRRAGSQRTVRGTPSSTDTVEPVSFDGGVTATCRRWRPESGEAIESLHGFRTTERLKATTTALPLFEAMFPFARRSEYFLRFGWPGLAEAQVIVPETHAESFLRELERLLAHAGART